MDFALDALSYPPVYYQINTFVLSPTSSFLAFWCTLVLFDCAPAQGLILRRGRLLAPRMVYLQFLRDDQVEGHLD